MVAEAKQTDGLKAEEVSPTPVTHLADSSAESVLKQVGGTNSATTIESTLNQEQRQTLETLRALHRKHLELEKQYRLEWNALKLKYFRLLKPNYDERFEVLKPKDTGASSPEILALPDFWLTALKRNSNVGQAIEPHDYPVLKYLRNITFEWVNEEEQMSFRFIFHFCPNPYFTNETLSKTYELEEDPDVVESVLTRTEGTVIDWKDGMDVTKKTVTRRQKNKKTGQMRTITQEVSRESIFNIFESREIPDDSKLETMSTEEVTDLENTLELEYEIGCVIRDKIIPHAVGWYLGIEIDDEDMDSADENLDDSDDDKESASDNELIPAKK